MATDTAKVPVWAIGLMVSLVIALGGGAIGIIYHAGQITSGIDRLTTTVEHMDRRFERVERAVDSQGNRITAIEAWRSVYTPAATSTASATSSARR